MRSWLVQAYVSRGALRVRRAWNELRRRISGKSHVVTVFLQIDDPYSYLLSCVLTEFQAAYDVQLNVRLCEALPGEFRAAPELASELAIEDCRRLAAELALPFLDKGPYPPTEHRVALAAAVAKATTGEERREELIRVLQLFWRGDSESAARYVANVDQQQMATRAIENSQAELRRWGHYDSGMLHYAGEWYWGIDRLLYLTRRLDELGLRHEDKPPNSIAALEQIQRITLPIEPPRTASQLPPLEFFFSFRSPYSYLAAEQVFALADAFGLQLQIRPVLPMIERGLAVPAIKQRYIVLDCARIAHQNGTPFGRLADPQGAGIRCALAAFDIAAAAGKERPLILSASRAIWAQAIDIAEVARMSDVMAAAGLTATAKSIEAGAEAGRRHAEKNQEALFAAGCWGVPTLKIGDYVVWGQDRIWLLSRHLETLCEDGDGILK